MLRYVVIFLIMLTGCSRNVEKMHKQEVVLNQHIEQVKPLGDDWVEVTTSVEIVNLSPMEARRIAIQKAYILALEYFGIEVGSRTLSLLSETNDEITLDHFSKLTKLTTNGIILQKEVTNDVTELIDGRMYKAVTIKIKIGKQKGENDPYFSIQASLNKTYFKENELIEIEITPSLDCYITVLFISSDDNVGTIFPNKYSKNNFAKAGETIALPTDSDKSIGLKYKVKLLENMKKDTEMIKVIATKKPVNIIINDKYETALESLQNWLVTIPLNEIEEEDLQYFIMR
ncbi:MAG: DUF4384 domain-containing protein [Candidatus Zophobacter franzmannii]|nr:DUF4384 domain-containing protein [Candidatus Zophobacter franzmannii]